MPITAQSDSIRINAVGEVISKPTAMIQKEKNFNATVHNELSGQPAPKTDSNALPRR